MAQSRKPKGTPTGGQFTPGDHTEADGDLLADDQPVRTELDNGVVEYRQHGKLHRDGGPAVTQPDGYRSWYQDGERHRDDGPAITYPDGGEEWWRHGEWHRDDGPAVIWPDGTEEWYQYGKRIAPPA